MFQINTSAASRSAKPASAVAISILIILFRYIQATGRYTEGIRAKNLAHNIRRRRINAEGHYLYDDADILTPDMLARACIADTITE